jgi:hypothetical protein
VTIHGRTDLTFAYFPSHIHYILLELLKNSMRATMEFHGNDSDVPPIRIVIADGETNEDVIIKVQRGALLLSYVYVYIMGIGVLHICICLHIYVYACVCFNRCLTRAEAFGAVTCSASGATCTPRLTSAWWKNY